LPTRWEVTKAVRASSLPAPSRLIMLTLADVAVVGTAEIPARWTPSLKVLAKETGLDKSTVTRHLNALDAAGWLERTRPDGQAQWEGERTRYQLTIPSGLEHLGVGAENTHLDAEGTQGGRIEQQGVGAENGEGGSTVHPLETDHSDQGQIPSDQPSSPAAPKQRAPEPYREDVERICKHLAAAVEANGSPAKVTDVWRREARLLIDTPRPFEVTLDRIIALIDWCQQDDFWAPNVRSMKTFRKQYDALRMKATAEYRRGRSNGHRPYRNPTDPSAYEGDL
jgi:hypothetical protein